MSTNLNGLGRGEKIILFLYEYGKGKRARIRFEDIVVGLFKKYPADFHLKGYKDYPDSGDLVHKPLYDFKKKGYLTAANKVFSLTDRGMEFAKRLAGVSESKDVSMNGDHRLSRGLSSEINRIKSLEGFSLFLQGKENELSENDFYNYLAVTVRTPRNAFVGRMESIKSMLSELLKSPADPLYASIVKYHGYLIKKYESLVDFFEKQ